MKKLLSTLLLAAFAGLVDAQTNETAKLNLISPLEQLNLLKAGKK